MVNTMRAIKTPTTITEAVALSKAINDALRAKGYVCPTVTVLCREDGSLAASGYYGNPDTGENLIHLHATAGPGGDFGKAVAEGLAGIRPLIDLKVETLNRKMADVVEFAEKVGLAAPELSEAADRVAEILRAHMANNLITEVAS